MSGNCCLLAKVEPLLRDPLCIETPHRLLAEIKPPVVRIGPVTKCETDFHMHGSLGVGGMLFALALGVVMVVFDESREIPGVMPLPRSPRPQGPCPDTSA
jgi:hypothetical protein